MVTLPLALVVMFITLLNRCCCKRKVDQSAADTPGSGSPSADSPVMDTMSTAVTDGRPGRSALKQKDQFKEFRARGGAGSPRSPRSPRSPGGGSPGRSPRGSPGRSSSSPGRSPRDGSPRRTRGGRKTEGSPRSKAEKLERLRSRTMRSKSTLGADGKGDKGGSARSPRGSSPRKGKRRKDRMKKKLPRHKRIMRYIFGSCRRFSEWRAERKEFIQETWELIKDADEEDKWDYDNLDEFGNPTEISHILPNFIRFRITLYTILYWNPLVDLYDRCPSITSLLSKALKTLPSLVFLVALGWFGLSYYQNMMYEVGECRVHSLPTSFSNVGGTGTRVVGEYVVERFYPPTEEYGAGSLLQPCDVEVGCVQMDYGTTSLRSDDRCVDFKTFKWDEELPCYFYYTDPNGKQNTKLYCIGLPSNLQREGFTVVIAGGILLLTGGMAGLLAYRRIAHARHQREMALKQAQEEKEMEEAKLRIAQEEADEASRQRDRLRQEHLNFGTAPSETVSVASYDSYVEEQVEEEENEESSSSSSDSDSDDD
eukprot:TRINITY_DN3053_c0_g3_i1.p1 TRINITY_DN3053_c0_g3~~TRINITY_DN3053_c0_g3_i1.p1  ORF type:complete len:606 (-),score=111.89 TRINITY_DN3053_c0_g3_i1:180-1796(-)